MRDLIVQLRRGAKRSLPVGAQERLRALAAHRDNTVAEGWERIARHYTGDTRQLGDAWHAPEVVGSDVPPSEFVWHLNETIFAPFLDSPGVLLEIGPGGGRFTEVLLPQCRELIAADTSRTMLRILRSRFEGGERQPRVLHLDGRGLMTLASESVDAVFSYDVFVHLEHWDFFRYLLEIRRVLRADGKAIIHHANTFSPLGWEKFLLDVETCAGRPRAAFAFSVMTPELMAAFCARADLEVARVVTDVVRRDCITLLQRPAT